MSDLIEALQIFRKYGNPANPTRCSHDELAIQGIGNAQMDPEDRNRLRQLGFMWDGDEEYWFSFRFGS